MDLLNSTNPVLVPGQRLLTTDAGYQGADKYPFPRDCEAAIFDTNEDYVYIKRTDVNGATTLRRFHLEEEPLPVFDPKKYVTVDDLAGFKEEMINAINSLQQSINNSNRNPQQGNNRDRGKQNTVVGEPGASVQ